MLKILSFGMLHHIGWWKCINIIGMLTIMFSDLLFEAKVVKIIFKN